MATAQSLARRIDAFGEVGLIADAGPASALASATGASATGFAEALTGGMLAARANGTAKGGEIQVEASNGVGALLAPVATAPDAFARTAHTVSDEALAEALAGNTAVAAAMDDADAILLAALGAGGGGGKLRLAAEVELGALMFSPAGSAYDDLLVGFLDPTLGSTASLRLVIEVDGRSVFKIKLRGSTGPVALDDLVVELAALPEESLRIAIDLKTKDAASVGSVDFVVGAAPAIPPQDPPELALAAVPESRAWLLLGAAGTLAPLLTRGRARRTPRAS
jgi:hypothetical protein